MRKLLIICGLLSCILANAEVTDSIAVETSGKSHKKSIINKAYDLFKAGVDLLFTADTAYVEPNHYNFQGGILNTNSYETYRLGDKDGNRIRFAPDLSTKIGPYISYSFLSAGWSIDVKHQTSKRRKEFDMSFNTLPFSFDLFYRQTGHNYIIKDIDIVSLDASVLKGQPFTGFESKVIGASAYYAFNHKRFSNPAAFSRNTRQKRSQGSAITGLAYTRHSLRIDWKKFNEMAKETIGQELTDAFTAGKLLEKVQYTDFSVSGGYAYNWVFARNWLFSSSLSLALSYKRAISDTEVDPMANFVNAVTLRDFDFKLSSLNVDGVGRFGLNWTNDTWFAGATAIFHTFNYNKPEFYTSNTFGSLKIYAGVNFGTVKKFRNKIKHLRK